MYFEGIMCYLECVCLPSVGSMGPCAAADPFRVRFMKHASFRLMRLLLEVPLEAQRISLRR